MDDSRGDVYTVNMFGFLNIKPRKNCNENYTGGYDSGGHDSGGHDSGGHDSGWA